MSSDARVVQLTYRCALQRCPMLRQVVLDQHIETDETANSF